MFANDLRTMLIFDGFHFEVQVSQTIFVYGSLKRGYVLHHLLDGQQFLSEAKTDPVYRLFDLGSYPGLVEWPSGLAISGEVYRVDVECLCRLDEAEGVAERHYVRRNVQLQTKIDNDDVQAWFWLGSVRDKRDCGAEWP